MYVYVFYVCPHRWAYEKILNMEVYNQCLQMPETKRGWKFREIRNKKM
uniref:Uncharacterized protein n=1 Tax=Lepeophtheirus salmonis TaxID=72036 RepID=A0A0K2VE94_LEPSM